MENPDETRGEDPTVIELPRRSATYADATREVGTDANGNERNLRDGEVADYIVNQRISLK